MARLPDGSLLVATSEGTSFWSSVGRLIRLVDADHDGIADGPGTALFSGLPGGQTSLRIGGNLVFVTGQGKGRPISILRMGASPTNAFSLVGQISISYSVSWYHPHSALAIRPRNLWTIGNVPTPVPLYDRGELVPHGSSRCPYRTMPRSGAAPSPTTSAPHALLLSS